MAGHDLVASLFIEALDRSHFDHVGHEMTQQVLDAVPERGGRGGAARAGALHIEITIPSL